MPLKHNYTKETLTEALEAISAGIFIRKSSSEYGIPRATLQHRLQGTQAAFEAHTNKQKLSPDQEEFLTNWILNEESAGRAPNKRIIAEFANKVRVLGGETEKVGKHWVNHFLKRHNDLHTKVGDILESERAKATTQEVIRDFYDRVSRKIKSKDITSDNIINIDENGLEQGHAKRERVVGSALTRRTYIQRSEAREWVSIGEGITAKGRRLSPVVIFKLKTLQGNWFPRDLKPNWIYDHSDHGWMTSRIFVRWLRENIIPETAPTNKKQCRLLIMDGHITHESGDAMFECYINRIEVIYLPAHSSHVTQPLDVAVFSPLKTYYAEETSLMNNFDHAAPIVKRRFLASYFKASDKAFTSVNITARFRHTGIWPFNPDKLLGNIPGKILDEPKEALEDNEQFLSTDIPESSHDINRRAAQLEGIDMKLSDVREFMRDIGQALNHKNITIAAKDHEIKRLQDQLASYQPARKKKVKENPSDKYETFKAIKDAQKKLAEQRGKVPMTREDYDEYDIEMED